VKLTAITARTATLPAGKSEIIYFDEAVPGFGLRLRRGGGRGYVFQYKLGTKQRRMSLGAASARNIGDIRKTAEQLYHRVKLGEDPASDRTQAIAAAAQTFEASAREFLEGARDRLSVHTYHDCERHLLRDAKTLHQLQLAKITRADIASVLTAAVRNSGAVTANRVRTSLGSFFAWGLQHGRIEANPVVGTARSRERPRERVLSTAELKLIWEQSGESDHAEVTRLLILTAQRAGEIGNLRWSEIHGDAIVLPSERTKNRRPHTIPLSATAADILAQKQRRSGRDLIFGKRGSGFGGWSKFKKRLDERIAAANGKPLPPWVIHDIRRSAATCLAEIGVLPHVIESILNHVKPRIEAVYNKSTYEAEKRTALNRWAAHLAAILDGESSNITPLRSA
jgi:integrase